ncbi:MAG: type IV pilin, partial [Thermoplasmata archaeon]|nr:type IV pilin [Thermoplasmata archaeon]
VSPIIAIILMVAITVVLAATIYVWVSGFGGGGSKAISMSVTQINSISNGNATFRVDSVSQGARWNDINVTLLKNGTTPCAYYEGSGSITAGDTFYLNTSYDSSATYTLQIRDKTSNSVILTKTVW